MPAPLQFEDGRASTYRKTAEVLAFRSDDAFQFEKPWGVQVCRAGSWLLVPIDAAGQPTGDAYGCDADVFEQTYEPSPSGHRNQYQKRTVVRAYQPGVPFEVETVLADGHQESAHAATASDDAWIVQAPGGEVYPIENTVFARSYEHVVEPGALYRIKTRDEHWRVDGGPKRILSLDGGGVRGILTIGYLERIEALLRTRYGHRPDFRLCHYFDLIAGTSTGAIIAALLALGKTVAEVRKLYMELAEGVFQPGLDPFGLFFARFEGERVATCLRAQFGDMQLGSERLLTGLLVMTKRLDSSSPWPLANNPFDRYYSAGPGDDFTANKLYPVASVVRASTAAPTYFDPEEIEIVPESSATDATRRPTKAVKGVFVDGGVSPHNNPALQALQLATLEGYGVRWATGPDKLLLVSVGTGTRPNTYSGTGLSAKVAQQALMSLMDDCSDLVETVLQWLSTSPTSRHIDGAVGALANDLLADRPLLEYLRYNVWLEKDWLNRELDGLDLGERRLKQLARMDRPKSMPELYELGLASAVKHVQDVHFPPHFDLG